MSGSSATTALQYFGELRDLFPTNVDPEKFNLYHGLAALAQGMVELQEEVDSLAKNVQVLMANA